MSRNIGAQSKKDLILLALGGLSTRYAGRGETYGVFSASRKAGHLLSGRPLSLDVSGVG